MAKRSPATQWAQILIDAAESVRTTVRNTLLNKTRTEVQELKRLLDSEAQKAIHASLKETGYPVNVISEEGDYTLGQGGPYLVVDPVDGTTNLAKSIHCFFSYSRIVIAQCHPQNLNRFCTTHFRK